jgi:hypothetical protein
MAPGSTRSRSGSRSWPGRSLKGASFASRSELIAHIDSFIADYKEHADPFVWTKSAVHQTTLKPCFAVQ